MTARADASPPNTSAARCRATPTVASRSESPAVRRATTTGRGRAGCIVLRAAWPSFLPQISAGGRSLREAMNLPHQDVGIIGPRSRQALAWEALGGDAPTITKKYGGLHNASAYIGMMLRRKLGIVILGNRGNQYPNEVGRRILL